MALTALADDATMQTLLDHIAHDPIVSTLKTVEQDLLAHVFAHKWIPLHWKVRALSSAQLISQYNALRRMFQDHVRRQSLQAH